MDEDGAARVERACLAAGVCPYCGREFDYSDIACHAGSRGPSYNYHACNLCKKAWLIGTFERFGKYEVRETKYLENTQSKSNEDDFESPQF